MKKTKSLGASMIKAAQDMAAETSKEEKTDPYTEYLKQCYDWYNDLRKKENKTSLEISYIIAIEERHKMEIINQFQTFINHLVNEK